jgi:ABC-type branched-subunit amino acid transport system ATPase component
MTVLENVMLGTHLAPERPSPLATLLGLPSFRRHEAGLEDRCRSVLDDLHIAEYAEQVAGQLPYGVQKRVDLARSLVADPRLLLLDEPAAGLTETESRQLVELIRRLHDRRRFTLLLVEHDMHVISSLCERITAIDFGRLLAAGTPAEVRRDEKVMAAYLGTGRIEDARPAAENGGPAAASRAPIIEVAELEVRYGAVPALREVRLAGGEGRITAIVGANGAGKSTLLAAIGGVLAPHRGTVRYRGGDVTGLACEERVKRGIVLCPEGRRLFPEMTVEENLLLGAYQRDRRRTPQNMERVFELFPRIAGRRRQSAGTLSGGEQQMVSIGRALMAEPELLLLDEPSLGLAPNLVELIFATIAEIRRRGCSILLVEQNASMALEIADEGYVMETGRVTLRGPAAELRRRRDVVEAYLG